MTLLAVLLSVLSFVAGLWSATYLQDRATRRRHLGLARALKAELDRIHDEAGMKARRFVGVGTGGLWAAIPQMSGWTNGFVAELASGDTNLLAEFIKLDRYLKNLSASSGTLYEAIGHQTRLRDQLDFTSKSFPQDVEGIAKCAKLAADAEESARSARESVDIDFDFAKQVVGRLSESLGAAEPQLAAGLRTHLPWGSARA